MRLLAAIYLAIALTNFGFWFSNGSEHEVFTTFYAFLSWGLYFFSLLSLLAYILGKLLLPQRLWQVIFAIYLFTRLYELFTRGLVLTEGSLGTNLNIISSYLWLVVPPGLAMWHMAYRFVPSKVLRPGAGTVMPGFDKLGRKAYRPSEE